MNIVRLTAAEAEQYRAVMLHAYEHSADAFTSTPEERAAETLAWWVNRLANPAGLTVAFGAFQDASLVGVVALEFNLKQKTAHKVLVVGMYVMPVARGKGIARQLLRTALAYARTKPRLTVAQLEVTEGNAPAITLYSSLGFTPYGVEPLAVLTPDGYRSKVHMWVPLGAPTV